MKKFLVTIPIAGFICIEVEASSKKGAIDEAWDIYSEDGPDRFDVEWDAYRRLTSGNVLHAPVNEEEATNVDRLKI